MSAVSFRKQFQVEFKKSKQLLPVLMTIALLFGNIAYLYFGLSRGDAMSKQELWEQTYCCIPLMNTLLLPVFMAVLGSLSMDLEHKGNTWNLLQTMQSRRSIFLCKTLYGLYYAVTFVILQEITIVAIGKALGFSGALPVSVVIISAFAQILAGMVVYQIGCLLSLLFSSQFAAISINLGGTLAGLLLLLVTTKPVTPWSILGSLEVAEMNFDASSETVSFEWVHVSLSSWVVGILYFAVIFFIGLILYTHMEEGSIPGLGTGTVKSSSLHTSAPAEILKLKRSPIWIPFFCLPIISAAVGTFNFSANQGTLSFTWESLWTQHSLFLGIFFLPPLIAILCSLLLRQEHSGTNWNLILTLESPWKIVGDKTLVSSGMSVVCMLWIAVLYIICGKALGIPGLPTASFPLFILCGILSCIAISAVQVFLSTVIRPFAVPIGIALGLSVIGIACVVKGWIYALPTAMLQAGIGSTTLDRGLNLGGFIAAASIYVILFYCFSVLYLKRSDVKTHE